LSLGGLSPEHPQQLKGLMKNDKLQNTKQTCQLGCGISNQHQVHPLGGLAIAVKRTCQLQKVKRTFLAFKPRNQ
jgi:hypothetical protein